MMAERQPLGRTAPLASYTGDAAAGKKATRASNATDAPAAAAAAGGGGTAAAAKHEWTADDVPTFSFSVTVCFTLNYIIGTGFLTLPWGFFVTGVPLGLVLLGAFTVFSMGAALCILEALARAEVYATSTNSFGSLVDLSDVMGNRSATFAMRRESENFLPLRVIDRRRTAETTATTVTVTATAIATTNNKSDSHSHGSSSGGTGVTTVTGGSGGRIGLLVVGQERFEVTELCKIFLGKSVARCYTLVMAVYLYCSLWAYATVFANSLTARLPLSFSLFTSSSTSSSSSSPDSVLDDKEWSFRTYLLLFALITVPASLLELSEQVTLQVHTGWRITMSCSVTPHSSITPRFAPSPRSPCRCAVWSCW
jgi:hypothetical protein